MQAEPGDPVGPKTKEVFILRRSHDGTKRHGSSLKNCPLPNTEAIKNKQDVTQGTK